jgi:cytochrome P450
LTIPGAGPIADPAAPKSVAGADDVGRIRQAAPWAMGSPVATDDLVMLDITDPALDPHGPEIRAARAAHWCARTPMGLAVLRHDKLTMLLGDRRLVQGSHRILTAQGLTTGPLVEWMNTMILSMEGDDHLRVRRLVSRAFTPRAVTALRPRMREIAHQLVDGFPAGDGGTVEFMAAFADPFPARVICELLGVPPDLQETVGGWANDLGLAFSLCTRTGSTSPSRARRR